MSIIDVTSLWKIFGPQPDRARELADSGVSREDIQEQTKSLIAVRDVSFEVHEGETFVVMGLSGSGKSTLIRCLTRLVEPTSGEVHMCGQDFRRLDDAELREMRRHRFAMVFQHFGLFPHRTVADNVAFGLEIRGIAKEPRRAAAMELLETVGLGPWADSYPQQLSGGMQQRVGLARALAVEPDILFFDEPFSALDPLIRRDMQDELIDIQLRLQRTLVFITHDFTEALRLADRIAIMRDGAVVQVGTAVEIITDPADDYVRSFVQDAPRAKVLTASHAMGSVERHSGTTDHLKRTGQWTPLEELIPALLSAPDPIAVTDDDGQLIGLVTRQDVGRLLDTAT